MRINRRNWLRSTSAVGFGSLLGNRFQRAVANAAPSGRFRRCLVLWMEGGPSQLDTFDPKRHGPRGSLQTKVDGLSIADCLPSLAERADQLCVLRSVGSREGEHTRATELMHTGFAPVPSFPRPAIGSMISSNLADPGFPRYVTLGGFGFGPAFLGSDHGPFVIEDIEAAKGQLQRVSTKRGALDLLSQLNASYAQTTYAPTMAGRTSSIESVRELIDTAFPESLDLEAATASDRERYGDHQFGRRVLTARRLLTLGVPFVEAQLPGWDTHFDNQNRTGELCQQLEQPWIALMDDLQNSGMWDDTLIVWMGEFGRTPRLNGRAGRDHFPEATPVVLAGGDLGGRVLGRTSDDGSKREGEIHSVGDLMATVLSLLGFDTNLELTTEFGSPTTVTDQGTPIAGIV
ncbi:MAG: DUF1501 domain-containing protein [Rubripirellula sp.]